ncbi:hypothetical protein CANCADRAFT_108021 [Tortispora caseinolytica NRRL Y-17796]|uniref:Anaphase-promoting complex subunit 4 WD40 domain-containing protein n=1 Tax=Tortispora caseinolytica NRRL Y-17796 TaxID=767744 RepID=A0A1E4TFX8_9ASCO|nr:hypothetical protein CANCADRAFT_108021 [Tortispora caseinolytica NRRL Y-17796]
MNLHNPLHSERRKAPALLSAAFNQDQGCFAIGHEKGFRVYSTDPMEARVRRDFNDGGIGIAQMLYRTNYLALVGGGRSPKFSENKVVVWDDLKKAPALSLEFYSPVLSVQLSRTRIVVCGKNKIHIYAFSSPPLRIAIYETSNNPHGICALSSNVLAFPARTEGQIQVVDLSPQGQERNLVSIVKAHKSPVRCIALSNDGALLASASEAGTIIRIHSTQTTALVHEFRRGLDRAEMYSMAFSPSARRLAVLSDKGTLHVYDSVMTPESVSTNRKHFLSVLPLLPSYFSSEWSFVSYRVREDGVSSRGVLGWSSEDSVIAIFLENGRWEKYAIVKKELTGGNEEDNNSKWELVREGWRSFEDLSDI